MKQTVKFYSLEFGLDHTQTPTLSYTPTLTHTCSFAHTYMHTRCERDGEPIYPLVIWTLKQPIKVRKLRLPLWSKGQQTDSFSLIYGWTKQEFNFFQQFLSLPPTQERKKERKKARKTHLERVPCVSQELSAGLERERKELLGQH